MTAPTVAPGASAAPPGLPEASTWSAFRALLLRDLTVLDRDIKEFIPNTVLQPLLLVFIFTYVFPKIGQSVGGSDGAARFSTVLVGGIVAQSVIFQGIFRVAIPLARELDVTNELEDRVMAPMPVALIGVEKIVSGALQSLFAGLIVFPVAAFVPATPIFVIVDWPVLLTIAPLACISSAALGLTLATRIDPRSVPLLAGFIALPLGFFGAIFYPWDALAPIPWLKGAVLVNPLVYMSEGFRAGLSVGVPTMSLAVIYGVLICFTVGLTWLGIRGFVQRVLS
ncbi:MAG: ABC transporter permease [Acidimicrobiales bacterium]